MSSVEAASPARPEPTMMTLCGDDVEVWLCLCDEASDMLLVFIEATEEEDMLRRSCLEFSKGSRKERENIE